MAGDDIRSWKHPDRPAMGQYRMVIVVTGDDLGPDAMIWLVEHQLNTFGMIAFVEAVKRIGKDHRADPQ
jgi:hypothetical protein